MPPFQKPGAEAPEVVKPEDVAGEVGLTPTPPPSGEAITNPLEDSSKAAQKGVLDAAKDLEEKSEINALKKQIADLALKLESVGDKSRLNQFNEKQRPGMERIWGLSTYKGKLVIKWSALITNTVQLHHNNMHTFDQTTELTYYDGTKEKVDYQIWQRDKVMIKSIERGFSVVDGKKTFKLSTEKFGEVDIEDTFVN